MKTVGSRPLLALLATFLAVTLMSGCALFRQMDSGSDEQLLSASGFQARPADTPRKTAMLNALPPYKVVMQQRDGKTFYVYADPKQNVLYLGGPREYQKYQQMSVNETIAEENEMTAFENQMAASDWDWDAYGPFWW